MTIYLPNGVARITCGGKPLEGPYLPPASDLALLGKHLAKRYATSDTPPEEKTEDT